jgi:O-antigen ligase
MTPKLRIRRRRSSSRHGAAGTSRYPGGLASLITTFLLAVVLITGPLILGADRLWIELPLLGAAALLLVVQGLRLTVRPPGAQSGADAIDLSVALFVLYAIVRWLTSPAEYFSRIEAMDVVAYAGVFFTCRYGMANRKYCMALLYLLVILGVGETAFGYYLSNHLDWFPFVPAERLQLDYAPRWVGTYESPNHYAALLVMAIGAALALGSFSKLAWPVRIILFYVSIMMMVGVMYSGSRGGWIALLAAIFGLVIMGIRNGTMRWWLPVTGALALIAVSGFLFSLSPVAQDRLADARNLIFGGRLAADPRVQLAADALRIAHDHPFFGTGPGTFVFIYPRYQDSTFASQAEVSHNDYLNCLDDYGLVGFGVALFFVAAVTLKFFRPLVVDNRWQDRVLVATGFAAWVALLVHSLVDFNLHIPANALLLFSLTGLALGRLKEEWHWSTLSLAPLGRWLGWGVVLLSLIYGVEVARTALSDWAYERAVAREDEAPISESIAGAEEALGYDRGNAQALVFLGDLHRYQAALQKNNEDRLSEGQKALDAYQKALQANSLDDSVQARMGMASDLMRKSPPETVEPATTP